MLPNATPVNLLGMDRASLAKFMIELGAKPFTANQLFRWIYQRGVTDFDAMSDLSKHLRETLKSRCVVAPPAIAFRKKAEDGTLKWLIETGNKSLIEMVYIPEPKRGTLCISSQVGCTLDCSFCSTGKQGFQRNLSASEITGQLFNAVKEISEDPDFAEVGVTNVVMMGMGEPLLNLDAVIPSLKIMLDDYAYNLSKRRVTVSTSGVVPAMYELFDSVDTALAVSLHAPNDLLRNELVPINKKYPLETLLKACRHYLTTGDRLKKSVTIEYVMLKDVNDTDKHARELIRLLNGMACKVNLIPFNPFPNTQYERSTKETIARFTDMLTRAGLITTTRKTRGEDIDAACGQLAGQVQDRTRRSHRYLARPQSSREGASECLEKSSL